jgi:hypothetical protein
MNNYFRNAYNAVSAIVELSDIRVSGNENPLALAISNLVSIIHDNIDAVPFELVRNDQELQKRLKAVSDYAYYLSSVAFSISKAEGHVYSSEISKAASVLFRGVSDIQNDLNGEERFDWGDLHHWRVLAKAEAIYDELSNKREAA